MINATAASATPGTTVPSAGSPPSPPTAQQPVPSAPGSAVPPTANTPKQATAEIPTSTPVTTPSTAVAPPFAAHSAPEAQAANSPASTQKPHFSSHTPPAGVSAPKNPAAPHFPPSTHDHSNLRVPPTGAADTVPSAAGPTPVTATPSGFPPAPPKPGEQRANQSSSSGVKSSGGDSSNKRRFSPKTIVGALIVGLMVVGGAAGFYLTQQNQDLRQQASTASCGSLNQEQCSGNGSCYWEGSCKTKIPSGEQGCCSNGDQCPNNQSCSIGNGACQSGTSCDPNSGGDDGGGGGDDGGDDGGGSDTFCEAGVECQPGTETCWSDGTLACVKCNAEGTGWESSVQGTGRACQEGTAPDGSSCSDAGVRSTDDDAALCELQGGTVSSTDPHDCPATGGIACAKDGGIACAYADPRQESCGVIGGGWTGSNDIFWEGDTLVNNSGSAISIEVCTGPDNDGNPGCPISNNCQQITLAAGDRHSMSACEQVDSPNGLFGGRCVESGCGEPPTGGPNPPPPPPPTQTPPVGYHDTNTCDTVLGWSCDPDKFDQNVDIHFWVGTAAGPERPIGSTRAGMGAYSEEERAAIAAVCGGNGNRRFAFDIPGDVKANEVGKYIYAYAINIDANGNGTHVEGGPVEGQNKQLVNSPRIIESCTSPTAYMSGRVYCADNNQPVIDAQLELTRQNSVEINMGFGVNSDGFWTVGSKTGFNTHAVRYLMPDPTTIGTGPRLNTATAELYGCTIANGSYTNCTLREGENTGFDFIFDNCAEAPPKPTADFTAACTDYDPSNGLNYTFTVSNIAGTPPFMWSRIYLGFSKGATGSHVQAIRDFLGTPTWDLEHWYGYQLHEFGHTSYTIGSNGLGIGNLTLDWNNTTTGAAAKIGYHAGAKTVAELAAKTSELLASSSVTDADKAKIRTYSIGANVAAGGFLNGTTWRGGSQNDSVGSARIAITNAACTQAIGPMCMNITPSQPLADLELGDQVSFTCGADVQQAGLEYEFRIFQENTNPQSLTSSTRGAQSLPYSIDEAGIFYVQCRVCDATKQGTIDDQCMPWENPPVQIIEAR